MELLCLTMAVRSLKLLGGGGGAVRVSEGRPADDDDLASEKGHLLEKRVLFSTITRGGGGGSCPPPAPLPPLGTALVTFNCILVQTKYKARAFDMVNWPSGSK